ncbi:MAG: CHAT domain-containing tetratricopeptide repeat protein [Thermodesulfobacteriota bacterium]
MSSRGKALVMLLLPLLWWGCEAAQRRAEITGLYQKGQYSQAIPQAREALAVAEKDKGPDHLEVAAALNLLALLYYEMGDYDQAEPLLLRAVRIREKALGPKDLQVAVSLNNLALVYDAKGDFAQAEPLYRRALEIREKELEPDHPDIAVSLNNLAGLYYNLGDYSQALPLYQRALEILEKSPEPNNAEIAAGLGNLAGLHLALGDYGRAEPLYLRALDIQEKSLGREHPDLAASLNNLALLYQEKGDLDKAEPLYQRTLSLQEKVFGPNHPDLAAILNNLAMLYSLRGDPARAEAFSQRALTIVERSLGPEHPDVAASLDNLAGLYAARGDYVRAHGLFKRAQEIDRKSIEQVMGFTSEDKKASFLAIKQSSLEGALSLVAQHLSQDKAARRDALNYWLSRKGIILEAQRRFQEALVQSDNPQALKTFQELSAVRSQISKLTFAGPGQEGLEAFRLKMGELEKRKDALDAELSRLSQAYAVKKKIEKADAASVARALPAGSAFVEFARVNYFNFKARGREDHWRPAHYLAFVLPAGDPDRLKFHDLGSAEAIDRAVADFRSAINDLSDKQGARAIEAARRTYDLVFAPLRSDLAAVNKVLLSPDGGLNLIPFEVLTGPDGRFLIETYTFNYLSTGRDVLGFGQTPAGGETGQAILVGDPDFDLSRAEKNKILARLGVSGADDQPALRSRAIRGFNFSRLPGTREEVEAIQALFGPGRARLFAGAEALEEALRRMKTPRVLHLATHGFFLTDAQFSDLTGVKSEARKTQFISPLLRSGLALAGANQAVSAGGGTGDGIFTAEKVLGLRLRGTELVVLSACETGVGEIKSGEGVYGLRRAFTQAGAQGLVMSLWAVPDAETKELMVEFYQGVLAGTQDRSQALRQAALKQMNRVKERYGRPLPFYWGAFVYLGQP